MPTGSYEPYLLEDGTYAAGFPSYPRNFPRDILTACLIDESAPLLRSQLEACYLHQGKHYDAQTGEEPGKIHHEWPGVQIQGRGEYYTTYNACDTSALYLITARRDPQWASEHLSSLNHAVEYILRHVHDDIFVEDTPTKHGRFSLYVTYWKDSIVPSKSFEEGIGFPVAYALAHFINARGLLAAAELFGDKTLAILADRMYRKGIVTFLGEREFITMSSARHTLRTPSSDELYSLAFIPPRYADLLPLYIIRSRAEWIESSIGYACTPWHVARTMSRDYHGYVVWPQEQAMIHRGAMAHGLYHVASVARRILPYINEGNELVNIQTLKPDGNPRQLWSVAARNYFLRQGDTKTLWQ